MNPHEEEEDEGPSVDSAIAEERIAARRIRIQRRLEAAKRLVELILFLSLKLVFYLRSVPLLSFLM